MYEHTNTMMETKTSFQIPQLLDGDNFTSEDLADDMEGLRLSFTRIKIPGGGHLQFEIPSGNPDVPDYCMELFVEDVQIAAASHDLFAKRANGQIYRPLVEKYIAGEKRL